MRSGKLYPQLANFKSIVSGIVLKGAMLTFGLILLGLSVFSQTTTYGTPNVVNVYTVGAGVSSLTIDMSGAAGGSFVGLGGKGGRVQATLAVTPGQLLYVSVGGAGGNGGLGVGGSAGLSAAGETGGAGGTATGGSGGGGASSIRTSIAGGATSVGSLNSRLIVAGGGGGGELSCSLGFAGGGGGYPAGLNGTGNCPSAGTTGGTQTAGGTKDCTGPCVCCGTDGSLGVGGTGVFYGGGGGGGYYGGGGGSGASGAGGSSYYGGAGVTLISTTNNFKPGNGTVSISPACSVPAIGGTTSVCTGSTTTLTNATPGGTWSSASPAVASVGTASGIVTGFSVGTAVISYTVAGCTATTTVTVSQTPSAISGTYSACVGGTSTLTNGYSGGTWTSSSPSTGSVGAATGVVAALVAGNTTITYTLTGGCTATAAFTVNANPAAIGGTASTCVGSSSTLTDATSGGAWSSSATGVATVVSGTGAVSGITAGNSTISYTLGTGCFAVKAFTVNPNPNPISGPSSVCVGLNIALSTTTGGVTWSSSNAAVASVVAGSGLVTGVSAGTATITCGIVSTGCIATTTVTVNPNPAVITGTNGVCVGLTTTLSNATGGGTWSSSTAAATVVGTTGVVTGVSAGTPTITYTLPTTCIATYPITVSALPAAIGGSLTICPGTSSTLTNTSGGGSWVSNNTAVATIGSGTGVATGVAVGTSTITYTLPGGCMATAVLTVNPNPGAITGTASVCQGLTTALSSATGGGSWSSSVPANGSVGAATGVVAGLIGSTTTNITYTLPTGCLTSQIVTINPLPAAIGGANNVCEGFTTTLTDATGATTWSSSNTANATIGSGTGIVTGVAAGSITMTFTIPATGCIAIKPFTVNPTPAAITGSNNVCVGLTTALSDASGGGSWASSNIAAGAVGSGTGIVTGVSAGNMNITYTLPAGCFAVFPMTVNAVPAAIGSSTITNFTTPGAFTYTVPAGVFSVNVSASGAQGGNYLSGATGNGGKGGNVQGALSVTPGQQLFVYVGDKGGSNSGGVGGSAGGTNAGENGGTGGTSSGGAGGGAASDVRTSITGGPTTVGSLNSRVFVGGGGGGASFSCSPHLDGGIGGFPAGGNGLFSCSSAPTGGSQTSGGLGTTYSGNVGGNGGFGNGGLGVFFGGGGGGGYFGGGGGGEASGAGGSSYAGTGTSGVTFSNGTQTGAGFVTISYVSAITSVCVGSNVTLADATAGGTWTSSNPAMATIGSATGVVTGISSGTLIITYALSSGCIATLPFTVNPTPSANTGTASVCVGLTTTLANSTSGGTWSSAASGNASVGSGTGVVTGVTGGTTAVISYTMPTGCFANTTVTVNTNAGTLSGATSVCTGATTTLSSTLGGGTWTSSNPSFATVGTSSGIVSGVAAGALTVTYSFGTCTSTRLFTVNQTPPSIVGASAACVGVSTTYTDGIASGAWTSSVPATITIGSASGVATCVVAGTSNIVYTLPGGCLATLPVTCNAQPGTISGSSTLCTGASTTLTNGTAGGSWTSSNSTVAPVSGTGVVTGSSAGTATISYTMPGGCFSTFAMTINQTPIGGTLVFCVGSTNVLTNANPGGVWSSSNPLQASIGSATGVVTGTGAGNPNIIYTLPGGCLSTAVATVNAQPSLFSITGGGGYCSGGTGPHVGLTSSTIGVNYQLFNGFTTVGSPVTGTGFPLDFGTFTAAGVYTVVATNTTTGCSLTMSGSTTISINPLPFAFTVTGGGSYCAGSSSAIHVGLSGSAGFGATYQLVSGGPIGAAVAGTGTILDFGIQSTPGTYTVVGTIAATGCTNTMSGSAIITLNAAPTAYTVTGGGPYCAGGSGVPVGLSSSDVGFSYQLFNGGTTTGGPMAGTGSALNFGLKTAAGSYTVVATNNSTGCSVIMTGTVTVTVSPLPFTQFVVAPAGSSYCAGGTGVTIQCPASQTAINYQLFKDGVFTGTTVPGTGTAISFGPQTLAGVYTVVAIDVITGCTVTMPTSVTVAINPLPTVNTVTVTGGGVYCAGGAGQIIGLSASQSGVAYQLSNGFGTVGAPVAGTGGAISFGLQTVVSTYTVQATNIATGCTFAMAGSPAISTTPLPNLYTMIVGGAYCSGGTGIDVALTGGSDLGISYQLYRGATPIGAPIVGDGVASPDWGLQTTAGTYNVKATNLISTCNVFMTGNTIVSVNPLPTLYSMNGGGNYCSGGTGVNVGITGSSNTVTYQLYNGAGAVGIGVTGTGGPMNFGLQTVAGAYYVIGTSAAGCVNTMTGTSTVGINPLPLAYGMTGGLPYCAGGTGTHIGLASSDINVNYQLYNLAVAVGAPVSGTGTAIDFGVIAPLSTYSVVATNTITTCQNAMIGTVITTTNPLPASFAVSGTGTYCSGGAGVNVSLAASEVGVNYQLYRGTVAVGSAVPGLGAGPLDMGNQTIAGTYTVVATNALTGCTKIMPGSATVAINPLPTAYTVTGGGGYCTGGTGVGVGLSGSSTGVSYMLYRGATALPPAVNGAGAPIVFPSQTVAGTYTVIATNSVTGCTVNMLSSVSVSVLPLPALQTVTGGGHFCSGGTGVPVNLSSSVFGTNYQLMIGASPVGSPLIGTGLPLSFGNQTVGTAYTVKATDAATGCSINMTGTAIVIVDPLPVTYVVTGGGNYCPGGAGVDVNLSFTNIGTNYQLYHDGTPVGLSQSGIGAAFPFGLQTDPGTYTVVATATLPTACSSTMAGSAIVGIHALPTVYTVGGGGSYCAGGSGLHLTLSGSDISTNYQLYNTDTAIGGVRSGTGSGIDFGLQTAGGVYMVVANSTLTSCVDTMFSTPTVVINPLPVAQTVTGGGSYCPGGTGADITLGGSELGVNYQLYFGSAATGSPVPGTGLGFNFGLHTAPGVYTVKATNMTTFCASNMNGSDTIRINSLPTAYAVTGGGAYCASGTGVVVGLGNSSTGVVYQLYRGTTAVGAVDTGNGSAITFGLQTTPGIYTIKATSLSTGCTNNMTGSATITINGLPTAYNVTGGGGYCAGTSGVHINLSGSVIGTTYQVMMGGIASGTPLAGTGLALDFGLRSAAGSYKVKATNNATGCSTYMMDSVAVNVNALPTLYSVTAGATGYCPGGAGVTIYISYTDLGVNYQLYRSGVPVGGAIAGTGSTGLDFGMQTVPGGYTVVATNTTTGCTRTMLGTATFSIYPLPPLNNVTGGGSYCAGGTGVNVGLASSNTGVNYQIFRGGTPVGAAIPGTGLPMDLGSETVAGSYTVVGSSATTGCSTNMIGTAIVAVNPVPVVYTVGGGGRFCAGGTGLSITLSGSVVGTNYRLTLGGSPVGGAVPGTGLGIAFTSVTTPGVYGVVATNASTGCTSTMTGTGAISVSPLPSAYTVTGGGNFCPGGSGVSVGLYGSAIGVRYQLYRGASTTGTPMFGTGLPVDFGLQSATGSYTIVAVDTATGCNINMTGSAAVGNYPLPTAYNVVGGGNYCAGGAGVNVGLDGSNSGVAYNLYLTGSVVGIPTYGTGSIISFGNKTAAGSYSVIATNSTTGCSNTMTGSATIGINPVLTAAVAISTAHGDTACAGVLTAFNASAVNGGLSPSYDWWINGVAASTGSSFSYIPVNGDMVKVMLHSSEACAIPDTASDMVTMTVLPQQMPTVDIEAVPGNVVCRGTNVTYVATAGAGGTAPIYEWRRNGVAVFTGGPSYSNVPTNGDIMSVALTSNYQCRLANTVLSTGIAMQVDTPITPNVTITVSPLNYIAPGESVTFTATVNNAVVSPTYQWYVKTVAIATETNPTYTANSFINGQTVKCVVTSGGGCGGAKGTSNVITIHVSSVGVNTIAENNMDLILVPNPNKGTFTIKGDLGVTYDQDVTVDVVNMLGQVIYNNNVKTHGGSINENIQLSNVPANGMYLLNVRTATGSKVFHMVIEQ